MAEIDARRSEVLGRSASKIQNKYLSYSACKKFTILRSAAIPLQAFSRGEVARTRFERRRREVACMKIQKIERMHHDRKSYKKLRFSSIQIQNGMRGMAARKEYNYKRQTTAAIRIQTRARQHLASHRYKKMRKVAVYAQSVLRKDLGRIHLRNLKKAAKDTRALEDAKARLEREAKELAIRLEQEERMRADADEVKNKERAKLESDLKEMAAKLAELEEAKNTEIAQLQSSLKDTQVQMAGMEEAKNNEITQLQSSLKNTEVQMASMEEAKNAEIAQLQSSLKETQVQMAGMEEAKNNEITQLQSSLKNTEVQMAELGETKSNEIAELQSSLKDTQAQMAGMEEAKNNEIAQLQSSLKDTETRLADLGEAKNKETAELQSSLKGVEDKLAEMEEAKNKDIANLQSALKDTEAQLEAKNTESAKLQSDLQSMEGQFQETKQLLESTKTELDQLRAIDTEKIENLTAENDKFQEKVNSLEQEISETQTKLEETTKLSEDRLQEAMDAENRIIDIKLDMQSLQEKIADMEAEEEILRHKQQKNGGPSKEFDSNLTQSTIGKERDLVEALMKAATQELGFSQGKPVATFVIYKSLLHWKTFELEITTVFDRIIQIIGSSIEKKEDMKHMAYWLSFTSTLFFLIQKTLSPAPVTTQQPTSLFGRMTKGFRSASIISIVHHVEAKYPALLFKKQLAVYVEKIYGFIRNSLKKDLSHFLSSCIQAPITSEGTSYPTSYWESIIESLTGVLNTLKEYNVPPVIIQKLFGQVYSFIDVQLFNSLVMHKECCTLGNGEYVKSGLAKLEAWCTQATTEYADSASDELKRVKQAVGFLILDKKSKVTYDQLTTNICPVLSIHQIHKICTFYVTGNEESNSVPADVISKLKVLMDEDAENPENESYLLDDNSSNPFPVEEISKSVNEKGFSDMKPPPELLENPEFQFLKE